MKTKYEWYTAEAGHVDIDRYLNGFHSKGWEIFSVFQDVGHTPFRYIIVMRRPLKKRKGAK
jgi:hypothetical protein